MKKTIEVMQLIGSEHGITEEDGICVTDAVARVLGEGASVALSFRGIEMTTTPFLRALLEPLLRNFSSDELNARLQLTEISASDEARIGFIIDDMKRRLNDPEAYESARRRALEMV